MPAPAGVRLPRLDRRRGDQGGSEAILGYSDISLIHLVLYVRTGLVGFHADMAVPGFGGHWQAAPATRQAELEKLYSRLLTPKR